MIWPSCIQEHSGTILKKAQVSTTHSPKLLGLPFIELGAYGTDVASAKDDHSISEFSAQIHERTFWRCLVDVSTLEIRNRRMYKYHGSLSHTFAMDVGVIWGPPTHWNTNMSSWRLQFLPTIPCPRTCPRVEGSFNCQRFHGLGTNLLTILMTLWILMILCLSFAAMRPIRKRRGWVRRGASTVRTEEQPAAEDETHVSCLPCTTLSTNTHGRHASNTHLTDLHMDTSEIN